MMQHVLHCDAERIFIPKHRHTERVAHQQHVDSSLVDQACGGIVIRGDGCNSSAVLLLRLQTLRRDPRHIHAAFHAARSNQTHLFSSATPPLDECSPTQSIPAKAGTWHSPCSPILLTPPRTVLPCNGTSVISWLPLLLKAAAAHRVLRSRCSTPVLCPAEEDRVPSSAPR